MICIPCLEWNFSARDIRGTKMKLTSMIALAVKWTVNERLEESIERGKTWREDRYRYCLSMSAGDIDRYNKLIATGVPDC